MNGRKEIGKIKKAKFGFGGYDDAMIGLSLEFGSDKTSWGCHTFHGAWAIERSGSALWTEQEGIITLGEVCMRLNGLLRDAKVSSVEQLEGVPVEVTFDGNTLKDYRILTEVI